MYGQIVLLLLGMSLNWNLSSAQVPPPAVVDVNPGTSQISADRSLQDGSTQITKETTGTRGVNVITDRSLQDGGAQITRDATGRRSVNIITDRSLQDPGVQVTGEATSTREVTIRADGSVQDGGAQITREVTGTRGVEISADMSLQDGGSQITREATGTRGVKVITDRSMQDGGVQVTREATGTRGVNIITDRSLQDGAVQITGEATGTRSVQISAERPVQERGVQITREDARRIQISGEKQRQLPGGFHQLPVGDFRALTALDFIRRVTNNPDREYELIGIWYQIVSGIVYRLEITITKQGYATIDCVAYVHVDNVDKRMRHIRDRNGFDEFQCPYGEPVLVQPIA